MTRATMQMRPLAAQANVEEKRIAELKARLKENLSLLDRERTCRELTRMQGELIKTSLCPKADISTWQRLGHFYLALRTALQD